MGFRFFNLNPISKSSLCRFFPNANRNFSHLKSSSFIVSSMTTQLLQIQLPNYRNEDNPNWRIFKRRHIGHSHDHHGPPRRSSKEGEKIFWLGLGSDIGLSAGKALTGYFSGSTAIIADAAHSLSDVVLSGVALLSFKAARIPKDIEHPYGHGKFETLGALGISGVLLITAGGIAWHAVDVLLGFFTAAPDIGIHSLTPEHSHHHSGHHHKIDMEHPLLALNMAVISISVKEGLYWITKRAGEREGSGLMKANAWHHRADAVSSLVAFIGVGGSILGVKFLDPLAGLLVSGMILKAGVETGYQSILELVDAAIPQEELEPHRQTILKVEGVKGCHRLRGRKAGSFLHLDVHIEVDPFTSVSAAHNVGENVRGQLHQSHSEVAEVFIHIDPLPLEVIPDNTEGNSAGVDQQIQRSSLVHKDVNDTVSRIISSKFPDNMAVEHITQHLLHGKILLEMEVSMPRNLVIWDAMAMAEEARKEILQAVSDVIQVHVQLRLAERSPTAPP